MGTTVQLVTQVQMNTFNNAIDAAEIVRSNATTQAQIDNVVSTLNATVVTFNNTKKAGTQGVDAPCECEDDCNIEDCDCGCGSSVGAGALTINNLPQDTDYVVGVYNHSGVINDLMEWAAIATQIIAAGTGTASESMTLYAADSSGNVFNQSGSFMVALYTTSIPIIVLYNSSPLPLLYPLPTKKTPTPFHFSLNSALPRIKLIVWT